ncbi:putative disease resistance RPP13-like protein 3 isoform X2 [Salvia hispanica]|nr:putative disease resistance RPP13-like protein 3 isoform X2 [Salvia hispanica]
MSEGSIIFMAIQQLEIVLAKTPGFCISPFNHLEFSNMTEFKGILEEIINELRMMLDFLKDKEWRVRDRLSYLLADFVAMARRSVHLTTFGNDNDIFCPHLATIRDWLRETKKRAMEFAVGEGVSRPQRVGEVGIVVGLEKDVELLVDKVILNDRPDFIVSSIKGMIGAGMTTLARQVYNHPDVIANFKPRLWITLSSYTSVNEVLVELIRQVLEQMGSQSFPEVLHQYPELPDVVIMHHPPQDSFSTGFIQLSHERDNEILTSLLSDILKGLTYFLVLDNIPKEVQLELIKKGLQCGEGNGSRLLLTSCHRSNFEIFYTHEVKSLDSDKSWQLFSKTFDKFTSEENKFSKELERKGREMLKKCWGLPLAIVNVARDKARQRLAGMKLEELFDSIDLSETLKLLEPMYHKLDEELKPCFLYMSFFKENAIMREEKLQHIWALRGIKRQRVATYMVDEFIHYQLQPCTYILASESIIEIVHDFRLFFEVKRCRINPLLHMLSIKIAEKELGFQKLRNNENGIPSQSPLHRVVQCRREKHHYSTNQDKCLVSLIFHGGGGYLDNASSSYWKSFELLSILDMEDFGVKTLSQTIGTLIELRYLGLRNNYIQEIPHSFGGLEKLEILDIALNFMVEVPDIINEMGSLRHLYMSDVIFRKALKVDALQNLETLTHISIYDWTYAVSSLEKMSSLYKLGIEEIDENSDTSKLFASLATLKSFEIFNMRGFRFKSMQCLDEIGVLDRLRKLRLDGRLARLPSAIESLRLLSYLVLVNTCLDEDPMQVLPKMSRLKVIKLRNAYIGREMVIEKQSFPSLDILRINELWNLRDVRVESGGMRYLKELEIKNCPHLENLPEQICYMRYLRKLKMVTTKHIATKIRNSGLISDIVEVDISP